MEHIGSNDSITVTIDDAKVIVVKGDVDLAGGPLLDDALARAESAGPVVIDVSGVDFIDSSGLRSLLSASRRAEERSGAVVLRAPSPGVLRLLELTGTTEQFRIEAAGPSTA